MFKLPSQWPSLKQWRQFFRILNRKEKIGVILLSFLSLSSLIVFIINFYLTHTEIKPTQGGIYIEGLVGSPVFINPLYAITNDVDRDLIELIYAGLMKYNTQGEVVPDLAKEYKILEDGKVYEFYLKENLFWSDGAPLTADDVVFTIKAVQNPTLKSPLRASWLDVQVEKISETVLRFTLKNPSANFIEKTTLKILPQHIWQAIDEQNYPLSTYNLNPIGAGPYQLKNIVRDKNGQIKSLELVSNPYYHNQPPYIPQIIFFFFNKEEDLISAFTAKEIKGLTLPFVFNHYLSLLQSNKKWFNQYSLLIPRYFAVFFNQEHSKVLADKKIRQAMNYGLDKEKIIDRISNGYGLIIDSPILPSIYQFEPPSKNYEFNFEKAQELIKESGFLEEENGIKKKIVKNQPKFQFTSELQLNSQGLEVRELQKCLARDKEIYPEGEITGYFGEKTKEAVIRFQEKYKEEILLPNNLTSGTGRVGKSTRDKLNELCASSSEEMVYLSFNLVTVNQPELINLASLLKEEWQKLGIQIEIKPVEVTVLTEEIIRPRNYDLLLLGQSLDLIPDPFPFWHSSQTKDPGLNLAGYKNKEVDKLLEQARQTLPNDKENRKIILEKFQNLLLEDAPAVFLYNPHFFYLVSSEIKGINLEQLIVDPAKRFAEVNQWYIKTKREWK